MNALRVAWLLLVAVACTPSFSGRTPEVDGTSGPDGASSGKADGTTVDDRGVVTADGFRNAVVWYTQASTDRQMGGTGTPLHGAMVDALWSATRRVDAGELSEASEDVLRSDAVPLFARVERARMIGERFERICPAASEQGNVFQAVMRSGTLERTGDIPDRWEGGGDRAYRDLFEAPQASLAEQLDRADCSASSFAPSIVQQSAIQAAINYMTIDVTLGRGKAQRLIEDPEGYVRGIVDEMPPELGPFKYGVEYRLREVATVLAHSITVEDAELAQQQARLSVTELVRWFRRDIEDRRRRDANRPFPEYGVSSIAAYGAYCQQWLTEQARANVLLLTPAVRDELCGSSMLADGIKWGLISSYGDYAETYAMSETQLAYAVADLRDSVRAYMAKLAAAWTLDGGERTAKRAVWHNVAGLGALLVGRPGCARFACDALAAAERDEARARFWDGVVMWGTVAVSVVAFVTVVGAPIAAGLGVVGLAATIATAASIAATVATLASAAYLGYRGAQVLAVAQQDIAALAFSGTSPERVHEQLSYGNTLVANAMLNGVLGLAEVAMIVHSLRLTSAVGRAEAFEQLRRSLALPGRTRANVAGVSDAVHALAPGENVALRELVGDAPLQSEAEIRQLVAEAMDPASTLSQGIDALVGEGGVQAEGVWATYFDRAYGKVLIDADGYRDLVVHAGSVMPEGTASAPARIADLGCGPGQFSAAVASEGRTVISVDNVEAAVRRTSAMLQQVRGEAEAARNLQVVASIRDLPSSVSELDGVIMNNVLYTQPDPRATVQMLAQRVKPGGVVYLNDPTSDGILRIQQLVEELAVSSWRNGGQLTRSDVALVATINSGRLTRAAGGSAPTFLSIAELRAMVQAEGFEIMSARSAYYDVTYEMVLRRLPTN